MPDSRDNDAGLLWLRSPQQRDLAYRRVGGESPGIVFFGGFRSDMSGSKAEYLDRWCRQRGRRFLRLDYSGHGRSGGHFEDGCIGDWCDDAEAVLEASGSNDWIFVGSSMGAWIALLLALRRPGSCRALVTLAAATDFTERLLWARLQPAERRRLREHGRIRVWSEYEQDFYSLGQHLFEDGRKHLLLQQETIGIDCPVRMIHGLDDADVDWNFSLETARRLRSGDARVILVKGADHRLSEPPELKLLGDTLVELIEVVG